MDVIYRLFVIFFVFLFVCLFVCFLRNLQLWEPGIPPPLTFFFFLTLTDFFIL